jgi:hypothetical protein
MLHTQVRMHTHIHTHTHTRTDTQIRTHIHIHTRIILNTPGMEEGEVGGLQAHANTLARAHTHTHTHAHMYTHGHLAWRRARRGACGRACHDEGSPGTASVVIN